MYRSLHKVIFSRIRKSNARLSVTAHQYVGQSRHVIRRSRRSKSARIASSGLSLSFLLMASAWATPTVPRGGSTSQGNVSISQSGNVMTLNQTTDKAVVNWQSFSIGAGAAVNIVQPSASSTHLSRVTGNDPSVIQGQLNSNGQVVLVNPNGIVVGKDGSVSASSFTASTLNITDDDFMAGKYQYARNGSNGEVVNQGKIQTKAGGYVALLGAKVTNEGTITSQQGAVYLGAGDAVAVPVTGSGRIKFEVSPAAINTAVTNNKDAVIVAEGGQVYMRAASLNDLAVASVQQSGLVDVSGEQGGNVTVLADKGKIKVDGTIKANSSEAVKGGNIIIGHDLSTGVLSSVTDASHANLETRNGFVETSGEYLVTEGIAVSAHEWLLDPTNIEINSATRAPIGSNSVVRVDDLTAALNAGTNVIIFTGVGSSSSGVVATTPSSSLSLSGSSSNNQAGDIFVNDSVTTNGIGGSLTLQASRDIIFGTSAKIESTVGALNIVLNSNMSNTGGAIVFKSGSGISSKGGNIILGGGSAGDASGFAKGSSTNLTGVSLSGATINAGGGHVKINAEATAGVSLGMLLTSSSQILTSNSGKIDISANGLLTSSSHGLSIEGNSKISSENGAITINALSGGVGNSRFGLRLTTGGKITTTGGNIDITAESQASGAYGYGAMIDGAGSQISTLGSGNIKMIVSGSARGTGDALGMQLRSLHAINAVDGNVEVIATSRGTAGNYNIGIDFQTPANVTTPGPMTGSIDVSGRGSVFLTGIGGAIRSNGTIGIGSFGISTPRISTADGNITLTGDSVVSNYAVPMTIKALNGTVTYQNSTEGLAINFGGDNVLSGPDRALGIKTDQLASIQASQIIIGNNLSGSITTRAQTPSSSVNGNIQLISGNQISINHAVNLGDKTIRFEAGADININSGVTTSNTTFSAISLVAGKPYSAGTSTGGDVRISTNSSSLGSLSAGSGAAISIYTGSILGSTGVTAPPGSYRYNSDELTGSSNYSLALPTSGVRVFYREKPLLTVGVNDVTKTYDGIAFTGGALKNSPSTGTIFNGDQFNTIISNAVIAGNAQGAIDASNGTPYQISASESLNALGYGVSFTSGSLTVNKAPLSISINNSTTNFGVVAPLSFEVSGLVNGETVDSAGVSVLGLSSLGYLSTTTTNAPGTYSITASGLSALNYELSAVNGITDGVLTINAVVPPEPPVPPVPPVPPIPPVPPVPPVDPVSPLDNDGVERNLPSSAPVADSSSQSSSASTSVVIGGPQGGDFQLASAFDCNTESCHCEKSEFDPELEICYEQEIVANKEKGLIPGA